MTFPLRQLVSRHFRPDDKFPDGWEAFLKDLEDAFERVEADHVLLKRTLDLTSEELLEMHIAVKQGLMPMKKFTEGEKNLALLRSLLDLLPDGIWVTRESGEVVFFNLALGDLWEFPKAVTEAAQSGPMWESIRERLKNPHRLAQGLQEIKEHPTEHHKMLLETRDGLLVECFSRPMALQGKHTGRLWIFRGLPLGTRV